MGVGVCGARWGRVGRARQKWGLVQGGLGWGQSGVGARWQWGQMGGRACGSRGQMGGWGGHMGEGPDGAKGLGPDRTGGKMGASGQTGAVARWWEQRVGPEAKWGGM